MSDEVKLLPCPFCGSDDVYCFGSPKGICMPNGFCMDCGARGPTPKREAGQRPNDAHEIVAARLWNTRAIEATRPTDEVVERVAIELLARLEEIDGNKAGAFTLRTSGAVGEHFTKKLAAVTASITAMPTDARQEAAQAFEGQEGDLHFELAKVLTVHWLTGLGCSHEGAGSNAASCWCGWSGPRVENVGQAVSCWVNHALEEMRPHLIVALHTASGTPTRRAETTGSVGEADGGPTIEEGDAHE